MYIESVIYTTVFTFLTFSLKTLSELFTKNIQVSTYRNNYNLSCKLRCNLFKNLETFITTVMKFLICSVYLKLSNKKLEFGLYYY